MKSLFATFVWFGLLAAASTFAAEVDLGSPGFLPTPQRPVGWRGDGTGRFPGATPVAEWDLSSGKNIVWKTDLPSANSSPIVAAGKVLLTCEPNVLVCLDADRGKELWRAQPSVFAAMGAKGKGGDEAFAECWSVFLETRKFAYNKVPGDLSAKSKALWNKLDKTYHVPKCGDHGYANSTPLSDGQAVYVKFGTGVVAKYDLDGKQLWTAAVLPSHSGSSPLLIGGKLVIYKGSTNDKAAMAAVALNPADGKVEWETDGLINVRDLGQSASPVGMALGEARLVICPGGEVLRAADGRKLGQAVQTRSRASSPLVNGDTVYFTGNPDHGHGDCAITAVKLALDGDTLKITQLWKTEDRGGKETLSSPLWHDGVVYLICTGDPGLYTYDAATGKPIKAAGKIPCRVSTHNFFPSAALGGPYIVAPIGDGSTYVVKPGADWSVVSTIKNETPTAASGFFQGSRLYMRDPKSAFCVGDKHSN